MREANERVQRARAIAEYFRYDKRLNCLGMAATFVFEDVAFALSNLADEPVRKEGEGSGVSSAEKWQAETLSIDRSFAPKVVQRNALQCRQ